MRSPIYIFISILFIISSSCKERVNLKETEAKDSYEPEYANFFKIEYFQNYKRIRITNPWEKSGLSINYILLNDSLTTPPKMKENDFLLKSTPKSVATLSSPMVGLLKLLKLDDKIKGVADPNLIYNEEVNQKVKTGEIENIGKSISLNMEKLLSIQVDLVLGSGWEKLSPDYERMIQLHQIPLLMYDWKETHPLGKAEWMVLVAAFFNHEESAIEQFKELSQKYNELKDNLQYDKHPIVFNGSEYQGIWYSAGGKSYMSQLIEDASAKYLLRNDTSSGSIMLDFEVIMAKAQNADFWIYSGTTDPSSLKVIKQEKYQTFKALKNNKIYSYHNRLNANKANDYWETASFQPHLVLQDFIRIFHSTEPEELYYFKQIETN